MSASIILALAALFITAGSLLLQRRLDRSLDEMERRVFGIEKPKPDDQEVKP